MAIVNTKKAKPAMERNEIEETQRTEEEELNAVCQ